MSAAPSESPAKAAELGVDIGVTYCPQLESWALWYPEGVSPDEPTPVIEIGEIFEEGSLAIVGSSLPRFLRMVSGFHLAGMNLRQASDAWSA